MRRPDLVSDCGNCQAICCIATSFEASEDFAFDKAAGIACRHLTRAQRCEVHAHLAARGLPGCALYDCYGAGPRATRAFAGVPNANHERNAAFLVLRVVHEWLWQLTQALRLCPNSHTELSTQLVSEIAVLDALAAQPVSALLDADLHPRHDAVHALLIRVGAACGGRRRALAVLRDE
jgi:hypothetical protein